LRPLLHVLAYLWSKATTKETRSFSYSRSTASPFFCLVQWYSQLLFWSVHGSIRQILFGARPGHLDTTATTRRRGRILSLSQQACILLYRGRDRQSFISFPLDGPGEISTFAAGCEVLWSDGGREALEGANRTVSPLKADQWQGGK
jgi:hypothetical protein